MEVRRPPRICAVCAAVEVEQCKQCKKCEVLSSRARSHTLARARSPGKIVYYCSRRCQKTHWKAGHKERCIPATERAAFDTPRNRKKLWETALRGDWEAVAELARRGADVNQSTATHGATVLFVAAGRGGVLAVKELLEAGADKDAASRTGETPLFMAAQEGHENTARVLLQAGADKDRANDAGRTPLHVAAQKGFDGIARALIDAGADKDRADEEGQTPLYMAAKFGYEPIARALLEAGADANHADNDGGTALLACSQNGYEGIVRALLDAGADRTKTICGYTALELAKTAEMKAILSEYANDGAAAAPAFDPRAVRVLCLDDYL